MSNCEACKQDESGCVCKKVDDFFEKAKGVPRAKTAEDLSYEEWEASKQPDARSCLACSFYKCRCSSGLKARLSRL